jgi:hypothetical protein
VSILIAPNDADVIYSPYNWRIQAGEARTINPGAYCRAMIAGDPTSIVLGFAMAGVTTTYLPEITYRIDGGPVTTVPLAATITVPIPTTNSWDKHLVEFWVKSTTQQSVNRWNGAGAAVAFTGFTCSDGATTEALTPRPRSGIVFGDSITEGTRTNLDFEPSGDYGSDAGLGWAFNLQQHLDAEIGVVGFGSMSWNATGNGSIPAFPNSWPYLWSGVDRSFTPAPDFIVINMGANGSTTSSVIAATLTAMAAAVPDTPILVLRPFGGQQAAALSTAVTTVANSRVTYVDTTGWWSTADSSDALHPYGYANLGHLAPLVANAVRSVLDLTVYRHFVRNAAGEAVPIS